MPFNAIYPLPASLYHCMVVVGVAVEALVNVSFVELWQTVESLGCVVTVKLLACPIAKSPNKVSPVA